MAQNDRKQANNHPVQVECSDPWDVCITESVIDITALERVVLAGMGNDLLDYIPYSMWKVIARYTQDEDVKGFCQGVFRKDDTTWRI